MSDDLFVMREKPKKPVRKTRYYDISMWRGQTLAELLETYNNHVNRIEDLAGVRVEQEYIDRDEDDAVYLMWETPEDEEEYKIRLNKYKKELRSYNSWYKKHKERVDIELREREEAKKVLQIQDIETRMRSLHQNLANLHQQLEELNK